MTRCEDCKQEMTTAEGCVDGPLHLDGEPVARVRFGFEAYRWGGSRCGDCGVRLGRTHHLGCDLEQCPECGDQLICCGCDFGEWEVPWPAA